jgi:hypothetical protein
MVRKKIALGVLSQRTNLREQDCLGVGQGTRAMSGQGMKDWEAYVDAVISSRPPNCGKWHSLRAAEEYTDAVLLRREKRQARRASRGKENTPARSGKRAARSPGLARTPLSILRKVKLSRRRDEGSDKVAQGQGDGRTALQQGNNLLTWADDVGQSPVMAAQGNISCAQRLEAVPFSSQPDYCCPSDEEDDDGRRVGEQVHCTQIEAANGAVAEASFVPATLDDDDDDDDDDDEVAVVEEDENEQAEEEELDEEDLHELSSEDDDNDDDDGGAAAADEALNFTHAAESCSDENGEDLQQQQTIFSQSQALNDLTTLSHGPPDEDENCGDAQETLCPTSFCGNDMDISPADEANSGSVNVDDDMAETTGEGIGGESWGGDGETTIGCEDSSLTQVAMTQASSHHHVKSHDYPHSPDTQVLGDLCSPNGSAECFASPVIVAGFGGDSGVDEANSLEKTFCPEMSPDQSLKAGNAEGSTGVDDRPVCENDGDDDDDEVASPHHAQVSTVVGGACLSAIREAVKSARRMDARGDMRNMSGLFSRLSFGGMPSMQLTSDQGEKPAV